MNPSSTAGRLIRVFSGIQPTGIPHLGNYFGAISQWIKMANECKLTVPISRTTHSPAEQDHASQNKPLNEEAIHNTTSGGQERVFSVDLDTPVFCIVDVHAYSTIRPDGGGKLTMGKQFYENILSTTAALLALGLDTSKCILFRQSDLLEHNYLDNVLDNFVSPGRLSRMTQFKEKTTNSAAVSDSTMLTNGLLNYPVLQAADILLYGTHLVPVGEDQVQHIELTRDIARKFNNSTQSQLFTEPKVLLNPSVHARRLKSLRIPEKKMSKSDADKRSFIEVIDKPDVILDKIKKAVTDSQSEVYYDAQNRPGVSNLMRIHHLVTGETFEQIRHQQAGIETGKYKLFLADLLIDKFSPVRLEYDRIRGEPAYLESVLKEGCDKAKPRAEEMIARVKHLLGSQRLD